jgi:glucokinase
MNVKLKRHQEFKIKNYDFFVIGADIGGTNTRIGFAGVRRKRFELLFSLTYPSDGIHSLSFVLKHAKKTAKEGFGIKVKIVCLACAGPITKERNFCEMTNVDWNIDRKKLRRQTVLNILPLINDLEAVSHSLPYLENRYLLRVHSGRQEKNGRRTVVATSTGLGKCMIYKEKNKDILVSSEFGNNDFSVIDKEDLKLAEFIKKSRRIKNSIQYEDVISGPGIENIYEFLSQRKKSKFRKEIESAPIKNAAIFYYQKRDPICRKTIKLFTKYYGRFIKNVVFDDLPLGGIYLMGGIPNNHPDLFGYEFTKEYTKSARHQKLLKSIPIFVILDDDAGLKGAAAFAANEV